MITTKDNPYNPYVDFDRWYAWDCAAGYYTCEYVARVYTQSDHPNNISPMEEDLLMRAVELEVLRVNLNGRYVDAVDPEE